MKKNHHLLKSNLRLNKAALFATAFGLSVFGYFLVRYTLASSATLRLAPSVQTAPQGSELAVAVRVDTGGAAVNVVQANLTYPADKLQFVSMDSSNSAFNSSAEASGGNGSVRVGRYVGGAHGSASGDLLVTTVFFKVLSNAGSAAITFANGSAVYSAIDSSDILVAKNGGLYNLVPAAGSTAAPTSQNSPPATQPAPPAPLATAAKPTPRSNPNLPAATPTSPQQSTDPSNGDNVPYDQTGVGQAFPQATVLKSSTAPKPIFLILGWLGFLLVAAALIYKLIKVIRRLPEHTAAINAPLPTIIYPSPAIAPDTTSIINNLPVSPPLSAAAPIIKFRQHSYMRQKATAVVVMVGLSLTGIVLVVAGRAASSPPVRCQSTRTQSYKYRTSHQPCRSRVISPAR